MSAHQCRSCPERFTRGDWLLLHAGRRHAATMTPDERALYHDALRAEEAWLANMRRHVRGGLYVLPMALFYFFFLLASAQYSIMHWAVLPAPGIVVFCLLAYWLAYTKDQAPVRGA